MKILIKLLLVLTALLALAIIVSGYFGTPILSVCDSDCKYARIQEAKAADGDIKAISFLYAKAVESGNKTESESLAMAGAFLGDIALQKAYLVYWNGFSVDKKVLLMGIFKSRSNSSKIEFCFVKMIEAGHYLQTCE